VVLQRLGLSSKTPVSLRHGPADMEGLDIHDLRTEIGIAQLRIIRNAIFKKSEVGKMIILSIKYSQIEAGIREHLLERPDIEISYLTPTWITSVRQYLFQHNLSLTLTDSLDIIFQGSTDKCIMQPEVLSRYTRQQQRDINLVRLYLQAITLSDISEVDGRHIKKSALNGKRSEGAIQRDHWPTQLTPTQYQVKIWKSYMVDNFLRYQTKWKTPLQQPVSPNIYSAQTAKHGSKKTMFDDPGQNNSLRQYIKSLPRWHKRLLSHYQQKANELEIWRAFRRKRGRTIDIASDGGLANKVGTFGWKMVTTLTVVLPVLFQGFRPH
jgi:hypothetical protein